MLNRRTLIFSVILAWHFAAGAAAPVPGATYYVRTSGDDSADGKSAQSAFATVLHAAGVINHGDDLIIGPGKYKETVFVADRFSADGAAMSVQGDESGKLTGDAPGAVIISSASPTEAALSFYRARHLEISGLTFEGPGQGLKLDDCIDATVARCSFDGLNRAVMVGRCQNAVVQSCVLTRNTIGLFFQGSAGSKVDHVSVAGSSSVGLLALSCGTGRIGNSILAANNTNLVTDALSARDWGCDHNVIHGTTGSWGDQPAIAKIHEWTAASGQDRHSVYVVPEFADPGRFDLHIAPVVSWPGGLPGVNVAVAAKGPAIDRDGKPFRVRDGATCAGAYDYPDPRLAGGWVRLAASIDGAGPRQSAGVYRQDGELVRTLLADAAGVKDLYWDGRDDMGRPAPAGKYIAKLLTHDVQVVDDGAFGDNGNPLGAYNCDNANCVCPLPDGGYMVATVYDEGQYPLRRYSASGQPTHATGLAEGDFAALASTGDGQMYAIVGNAAAARLVRLELPGERARMPDGSDSYRIFDSDEKNAAIKGLAVVGQSAYVAIGGLNVVRVIDRGNGSRKADWPIADLGDIAASAGSLWVVAGTDVASLTLDGKLDRRFPSGLAHPRYLAASNDRLAVIDNEAARLAILGTDGKIIRTLGQERTPGEFTPVGPQFLRDPRRACFLRDGRLVVTESARTRILFPDQGKISNEILSNFMDTAVVHPTHGQYVYCGLGIFRVDPRTGAWEWLMEEPRGLTMPDAAGKEAPLGSPATSVILDGRPFIAYAPGNGILRLIDVSEPLLPRMALSVRNKYCADYAYATLSFGKDGGLYSPRSGSRPDHPMSLLLNKVPFKGLDAQNNPIFDFEHVSVVGQEQDPDTARDMGSKQIVCVDRSNDDIYLGVVTKAHNKMVPAWGADATGVGKLSPDGKPTWFALSSGGNYMSVSCANDGKNTFIMAAKSFGGQTDIFDADGLRYTTGNWSWPCNYSIGFVDMRYGLNAYLRSDGKVGAYVEDDAIGRFARLRIDGAETIRNTSVQFDWQTPASGDGTLPDPATVGGKALEQVQTIPKVAEMKVNGDWGAWVKAGVVPQVVAPPTISYRHTIMPDDLWQTFSMGTAIGALAHDGTNLYVYFVVTDDPQRFDSDKPSTMFAADSIELWIEEEQFGLGLVRDGSAHLFKYRHHDRQGKEYSANYELNSSLVWGAPLDDVSRHPLGRQLAEITGTGLQGRKGYAVMARIPIEEIKLVGGIAGRSGTDILNMTGRGGETLRIGVAFSGITAWGHSQDYKVYWPSSLMFSDPGGSSRFVVGR
jgi:hypothetical protein